jgi:hypothetical protein
MNNNSWQFSFHEDKNISFCVASLLTGHYEHELPVNDRSIEAIQAVHNLKKRQAKEAIKVALNYIKNNK